VPALLVSVGTFLLFDAGDLYLALLGVAVLLWVSVNGFRAGVRESRERRELE
jgi:threonine/homoserine/homoserine lactone efflux protein